MDILFRIALGFFLFAIGGWVIYALFGILELLLNSTAYAFGRGIRSLAGLSATGDRLAPVALGLVQIAKFIYGLAIFTSIFLYAFFFPHLEQASVLVLMTALGCLLFLWAPSIFVLGLLDLGPMATEGTVVLASYREELAELGIVGEDADSLVERFRSTGEEYYVRKSDLGEFMDEALSSGVSPSEMVRLSSEYAETGIRPTLPSDE